MLKARLTNGLIILGLDAVNLSRLKEGKPIVLSLLPLGIDTEVMIMYGETCDAIQEELESVFTVDLFSKKPQ